MGRRKGPSIAKPVVHVCGQHCSCKPSERVNKAAPQVPGPPPERVNGQDNSRHKSGDNGRWTMVHGERWTVVRGGHPTNGTQCPLPSARCLCSRGKSHTTGCPKYLSTYILPTRSCPHHRGTNGPCTLIFYTRGVYKKREEDLLGCLVSQRR